MPTNLHSDPDELHRLVGSLQLQLEESQRNHDRVATMYAEARDKLNTLQNTPMYPWSTVLAGVKDAIRRCKEVTGQHKAIDAFIGPLTITHSVCGTDLGSEQGVITTNPHTTSEGTACANCHDPSHSILEQKLALATADLQELRCELEAERVASNHDLEIAKKGNVSEQAQQTAIALEKLLCATLGRTWSPTGMSVESLVKDLVNAVNTIPRKLSDEELAEIAKAVGFRPNDWDRLFYDSGPYEITTPRLGTRFLVDGAIQAACPPLRDVFNAANKG